MNDGVVLRDAAVGDMEAILEIYNDAILNTTAVYSERPHTLQMRLDWFRERESNNFPVFVTEMEGQVTGFSSYGHFRVWPCYRYTAEMSVYVHKDFRGKGVSKRLVNALLTHAKDAGLHVMIAGISADNTVSINLHQLFGFKEVAHFKQVGFKFHRWLDLKFFQLML